MAKRRIDLVWLKPRGLGLRFRREKRRRCQMIDWLAGQVNGDSGHRSKAIVAFGCSVAFAVLTVLSWFVDHTEVAQKASLSVLCLALTAFCLLMGLAHHRAATRTVLR